MYQWKTNPKTEMTRYINITYHTSTYWNITFMQQYERRFLRYKNALVKYTSAVST